MRVPPPAGSGLSTSASIGACVRIQVSSFGVNPPRRSVGAGATIAVEALHLPQPAQRVRQRAPLLDPRVDRHAGAQRGVLDRLEQRHRDRDLSRSGESSAYCERHDEQVGGHEHRLLGARDADRRVEHGRVERAAGERHEDPARRRAGSSRGDAARADEQRRRRPRARRRATPSRTTRTRSRRQLLPVGAVRDDADVDARAARGRAPRRSEPRRISAAPRLVRRADEDVGRAALGGDAADGRDEVVALLLEEVRAEDDGEPAQRRELRPPPPRSAAGRASAPRARRARRRAARPSATRAAGCRCDRGSGVDQHEHALGHRLLAERVERRRVCAAPRRPRRPRAARARAARDSLSARKKLLERHVGAILRVDLAGPQPLLQRLRRQVDEHDLVGLVEDRGRGTSRGRGRRSARRSRRSGSRGAGC